MLRINLIVTQEGELVLQRRIRIIIRITAKHMRLIFKLKLLNSSNNRCFAINLLFYIQPREEG